MRSLPLVLVVASGCAAQQPSSRIPSPAEVEEVKREAQRLSDLGKQSQLAAQTRCSNLATRTVPLEEETRVGRAWAARNQRKTPLVLEPPELVSWVAEVGQVIAQRSSRPQLKWTFGVLESDQPFARGYMGGVVLVSTGLLAKLRNEAQLAGVLAHEVAHVTARHPLELYQQLTVKQCEAATQVAVMAASLPPSDPQQELIKYARRFESIDLAQNDNSFERSMFETMLNVAESTPLPRNVEQAVDAEAAHLLAFTGYDAREYEQFLIELGDQPRHPPAAERATALKALRERELKDFSHATFKPDVTARVKGLRK